MGSAGAGATTRGRGAVRLRRRLAAREPVHGLDLLDQAGDARGALLGARAVLGGAGERGVREGPQDEVAGVAAGEHRRSQVGVDRADRGAVHAQLAQRVEQLVLGGRQAGAGDLGEARLLAGGGVEVGRHGGVAGAGDRRLGGGACLRLGVHEWSPSGPWGRPWAAASAEVVPAGAVAAWAGAAAWAGTVGPATSGASAVAVAGAGAGAGARI